MITKDQALEAGMFHANDLFGSDGQCVRWRRNGQTRTWKRPANASRFEVPVAYGLYRYDRITEITAHLYHTEEECPRERMMRLLADLMVRQPSQAEVTKALADLGEYEVSEALADRATIKAETPPSNEAENLWLRMEVAD